MKCTCSVTYLLNRNATYCGWVKELTDGTFRGKSYKKRYAVIHESVLYLFNEDTSSSTSSIVPLSQYKVQQVEDTASGGTTRWGFALQKYEGKKDEMIEFTVGSEMEMKGWMDKLENCNLAQDGDIGPRNSYIDVPVRGISSGIETLTVTDNQPSNTGRRPRSLSGSSQLGNNPGRKPSLPQEQHNDTGRAAMTLPGVQPRSANMGRAAMPLPGSQQQQQNTSRAQMPLPQRQTANTLRNPMPGHGSQTTSTLRNPMPGHVSHSQAVSNKAMTLPNRKASFPQVYEVRNDRMNMNNPMTLPPVPPTRKKSITPCDPGYYTPMDDGAAECEYTDRYMPPSFFKWNLDRVGAIDLLTQCGTPGVYIIRKGGDRNDVISAYLLGEIRHYKIFVEREEMFLRNDHPRFRQHLHLIMYYHENNLPTCHARLEAPYR